MDALANLASNVLASIIGAVLVIVAPVVYRFVRKSGQNYKGIVARRKELNISLAQRLANNPFSEAYFIVHIINKRLRLFACFLVCAIATTLLCISSVLVVTRYWPAFCGVGVLIIFGVLGRYEWKALDLYDEIRMLDDALIMTEQISIKNVKSMKADNDVNVSQVFQDETP